MDHQKSDNCLIKNHSTGKHSPGDYWAEQHLKRIEKFHTLCKETLAVDREQPFVPANRFICMNRLEQAIRRKNGAYSEEDRRSWLSIVHACLAAPDCYFSERKKGKHKKQARKFEKKAKQLQKRLELDRSWSSGIYTYIDCLRDSLRHFNSSGNDSYPYISAMKDGLKQALEKWVTKNPQLGKIKKVYQHKLDLIFQRNHACFNYPLFFLFLPYYVFWNLVLSEDDYGDVEAFSNFLLSQTELSWSVRNSPIKIYTAGDLKRLQKLYDLIEKTLCEVLQSKNYCCIGKTSWLTSYKYAQEFNLLGVRCSKFGIILKGSAEARDEEKKRESWVDEAVYFSAPLWRYQLWTGRFRQAFKLEDQDIENDLQSLFSLQFRPESQQTKRHIEKIRGKYQNVHTTLDKIEFNLFDLMLALSDIYNPARFAQGDTVPDELCAAITLLAKFLDEYEFEYPYQYAYEVDDNDPDDDDGDDPDDDDDNDDDDDISESDDTPIDLKWLCLLREGFPKSSEDYNLDDPDDFLINPSRELVKALFMRSVADYLKENPKDSSKIQDYFSDVAILGPRAIHDTPMETIQSAICSALPSFKNLTCDVSAIGRIKVVGKPFLSIREIFRVWKFWYPQKASVYLEIANYLSKKPSALNKMIAELQDIDFKPKTIEIRDDGLFSCDFDTTKRLSTQKNMVLNLLPKHLKEQLVSHSIKTSTIHSPEKEKSQKNQEKDQFETKPDETPASESPAPLNDFYYAMLLYTVFSVLRERMCKQAYEISLKILPFS